MLFPNSTFSSELVSLSVKEIKEDPGKLALCPADVQESLSRVRLVGGLADRLVWPGTESGRFSLGGFLSTISPAQGGRDFEWMWVPWIPRKIGGFLWRLFSNAIPVDTRIQGKGVPLCSKCRCCSQGHCETIDHLFISGELARSVWLPLSVVLDKPRVTSLFQLRWSWLSSGAARSQFDFVSGIAVGCGLWEIWCARNRRIHEPGQGRVDVFRAVRVWMVRLLPFFRVKVSSSLQESLSMESLCLPILSVPVSRVRWIAWDPGPGLTLNTDGSAGPRGSSGGGVIREVSGQPKLLFASRFSSCSSVVAEFEAALEGLRLARERGLRVVELQSDSKVLVDSLMGKGECPWSCVYVYRDIMRELVGVRVSHVFREANSVADRLASFALEVGPRVDSSSQAFGSEVRAALRGDGLRFRALRQF